METSQLFKYLHHMSMDEISLFIDPDESIENALYKLDMAARTRHIIHAVQLEDICRRLMMNQKLTIFTFLCDSHL